MISIKTFDIQPLFFITGMHFQLDVFDFFFQKVRRVCFWSKETWNVLRTFLQIYYCPSADCDISKKFLSQVILYYFLWIILLILVSHDISHGLVTLWELSTLNYRNHYLKDSFFIYHADISCITAINQIKKIFKFIDDRRFTSS